MFGIVIYFAELQKGYFIMSAALKKVNAAEKATEKKKKDLDAAAAAVVSALQTLEDAQHEAEAADKSYTATEQRLQVSITEATKSRDSIKAEAASSKKQAQDLNAQFSKEQSDIKKGRKKLKSDAQKKTDEVNAELKLSKRLAKAAREKADSDVKKKIKEVDSELIKNISSTYEARAKTKASQQGIEFGKDKKASAAIRKDVMVDDEAAEAVQSLKESAEFKKSLIESERLRIYGVAESDEAGLFSTTLTTS